jgi:hypothetical protein
MRLTQIQKCEAKPEARAVVDPDTPDQEQMLIAALESVFNPSSTGIPACVRFGVYFISKSAMRLAVLPELSMAVNSSE